MKCPICKAGEIIVASDEFQTTSRCNNCYQALTGPPGSKELHERILKALMPLNIT